MKKQNFDKIRKDLEKQITSKSSKIEALDKVITEAENKLAELPEIDSIEDTEVFINTIDRKEKLENYISTMEKRKASYLPSEESANDFRDQIESILASAEDSVKAELKEHLEAISKLSEDYKSVKAEAVELVQMYRANVRDIPDENGVINYVGHTDKGTTVYLDLLLRKTPYYLDLMQN